MSALLAFDIYGTLIDTSGILTQVQKYLPGNAANPAAGTDLADRFVALWRDKQLEYSFRRGLMQDVQDFSVPTRDALDFCCAQFRSPMTAMQRDDLMVQYQRLPAFGDAVQGLEEAKTSGFRLCAFSNGSKQTVTTLLEQAGLLHYFDAIISVEAVGTFKPHPSVYHHVLTTMAQSAETTWLVSGNPFDVIGARHAGLKSAWIQRDPARVFDCWSSADGPMLPTLVSPSLIGLSDRVAQSRAGAV